MSTALSVLLVLAICAGFLTLCARAADAKRAPITVVGIASHYGEAYRGKRMANGERFNPDAMTAAAWDWPLGSIVEVEFEGHSIIVPITDRGPAIRLGRLIDLSQAAFEKLAPTKRGLITVRVTLLHRPR